MILCPPSTTISLETIDMLQNINSQHIPVRKWNPWALAMHFNQVRSRLPWSHEDTGAGKPHKGPLQLIPAALPGPDRPSAFSCPGLPTAGAGLHSRSTRLLALKALSSQVCLQKGLSSPRHLLHYSPNLRKGQNMIKGQNTGSNSTCPACNAVPPSSNTWQRRVIRPSFYREEKSKSRQLVKSAWGHLANRVEPSQASAC